MTIASVTRLNLVRSTAVLLMLSLLAMSVTTTRAEDEAESATGMLETLKRRSAEERWQRVKQQYPSDPPAPQRKVPSRLPDEAQLAGSEDKLPSSSEGGPLIPRLTALPTDTSNDWVLPARQPLPDDDLNASASPDVGKTSDAGTTRGGQLVAARVQETAPPPPPSPDTPSPDVQKQEVAPQAPMADRVGGVMRNARTRTISDIDPFYDRTRDQDMREFALEKGKEFGLNFTQTTYPQREFPPVVLAWEASNFHCHPLYFADPALERYGHTYGHLLQPIASIGRFGLQAAFLPYQMTIDPICKDEYMLGYYRPGDCAPKLHYPIPLNAEAAVVQAGYVAGLYFVIP
ncbi:hypothetical protein [Schlesneria paludicola]|uniref:hypothetical protein n=1 Tax=Schlesneria paludicola TaxID=360056 RepID=UPI00029A66D6|nr:hypothetical protein [Schlesneria paludicola]